MSELTNLAAKIDAMTLDELMASASRDDLPKPGGDYDTALGWAKRCGVCRGSDTFKGMMQRLRDVGLARTVDGLTPIEGRYRRGKLIHCPALAAKCKTPATPG